MARSKYKSVYFDPRVLSNKNQINIKSSSTIVTQLTAKKVRVYNGRHHFRFPVGSEMVGLKIGQLITTRAISPITLSMKLASRKIYPMTNKGLQKSRGGVRTKR